MSASEYIPPATIQKLAEDHPHGTRHKAAMDIAIPLIGQGLPGSAVFATLRSKFPSDMPDSELEKIVRWAESKHPTPVVGNGNGNGHQRSYARSSPVKTPKPRPALEQVLWWTSGEQISPDDVRRSSPLQLPDTSEDRAAFALSSLYGMEENVNVVGQFTLDEGNANKTRPQGSGRTQPSAWWARRIGDKGVPATDAGCWIRMNPCAPTGSGADGAICDADVTAFRFLLVESDALPLPVQLGFYIRLKLPVAMILLSGGASAHAWIRLDSPNAEAYSTTAKRILSLLKPFGVDQANSNASRLSRFPESKRVIGAAGDGIQSLLWLNTAVPGLSELGLSEFEESLQFPAIQDKPMRSLIRRAEERYNEMSMNVGKLGVPTGITDYDIDNGGMKPGQTIVVAGITGGCKSTLALHMVKTAVTTGHGTVLFSLEMDADEVTDLIVADKAGVDRNKFNNGKFHQWDFGYMVKSFAEICDWPLYIEDSPFANVSAIRSRILQLKAAGKIKLVVVDYVQFVNPELSRETREQQIAGISHGLRAIARETRLPMVILSQLNDEGKLRESRVIAHNANVVFIAEVNRDTLKVKIVKGRGVALAEYEMEFHRLYARLVPILKHRGAEEENS